jgi:hypothetical protein
MKVIRIKHPHNEASALAAIHEHALLAARGWKIAFWVVSDEKPASEAVAALGCDARGKWTVVPLKTTLTSGSDTKPAEDCETLTRAGSWIYIFGSQYGAKEGPLEPRRHFLARFNESLVRSGRKSLHADLALARAPFALHRLVNDALRARKLALLPRPDAALLDVKKKWKDLVHAKDHAINVEGATFLPNGHLLLGLRSPATATGHPILVEIERIDRLFEKKTPEVTRIWIVENVGTAAAPAGIRELDAHGNVIHLITGDIDDPSFEKPPSEHHQVIVQPRKRGATTRVHAERVRTFHENAHVEGLAVQDDGTVWYAHDDDEIRLSVASL